MLPTLLCQAVSMPVWPDCVYIPGHLKVLARSWAAVAEPKLRCSLVSLQVSFPDV